MAYGLLIRGWMLGLLFGLGFALTSASSETTLNCPDFASIFNFITSEHLRTQYMTNEEKKFLLQDAAAGIPETLENLGYSMLSGLARLQLPSKFKNISENPTVICNLLENHMYRAAFLKSYAKTHDPFSDFFTNEELEIKTSVLDGEFIGVGIGTDAFDDHLLITEVVDGGPSDGKLLVDDKILKIDGHSIVGLSDHAVRQRIRGKKLTVVKFEIERKGAVFTVSITRNSVFQKSVSSQWLSNKYLLAKIHRFYKQTGVELEELLKSSAGQAKGIILDLRGNPGGLLQAARDVVDLFIDTGVVVYLRGKAYDDQVWATTEGGYTKIPLVVLVNEDTASAAEIVAGALQDYQRAVVVGQNTYGKGSVQNIHDTQVSMGTTYRGTLKVTTLWYYLPSGKSVHLLTPDIHVAATGEGKVHPAMPFFGPEKIDVPSLRNKSSLVAKVKAKALATSKKSAEDTGRSILDDMLAGF